MFENERQRRKEMWEMLIAQSGPTNVSPHLLRELRIYGGAQGIWVDKERTEHDLPPKYIPVIMLDWIAEIG